TAAELAIGHPQETDLLLHSNRIADRRVLDAMQLPSRQAASLTLGTRAQQLRRAQQTADVIGAERWTRHIDHRNLPISHRVLQCTLLRRASAGGSLAGHMRQ